MCGGFNDKLAALNYDLMMRFYFSVFLLIFASGFSFGQAPDFEETLLLAVSGDTAAQFNLAIMYGNGLGVPQNDMMAVKWWTKAAEQGYANAQYNLGTMYHNGRGVLENDKTAVMWYTKAAEQGLAEAQYNLGVMYNFGKGVLQNYKTAVKWYTKAAVQGLAEAQYNLGLNYANGEGVLSSNVKAYMWWNLAGFNGSKGAGKNKEIISKRMTAEQIAKAQELSEQCLASSYRDC